MCEWEKRSKKLGEVRRSAEWPGFDESVESREDRKDFIFSSVMPMEKEVRERACRPDSSLDRGATWVSMNSAAAWKGGLHNWCWSARMGGQL